METEDERPSLNLKLPGMRSADGSVGSEAVEMPMEATSEVADSGAADAEEHPSKHKKQKEDKKDKKDGDFFELQRDLITLIDEYRKSHEVDDRKMTLKAFSEAAGISVPTMTSIVCGLRWVPNCDRATVKKLAAILEIPVLQVYVLSGFIENEDTVYTGTLKQTLELIYREMSRNPHMTFKLPVKAVWDKWPQSAKLTVVMLYEDLMDKVLLRYSPLRKK